MSFPVNRLDDDDDDIVHNVMGARTCNILVLLYSECVFFNGATDYSEKSNTVMVMVIVGIRLGRSSVLIRAWC